MSRDASTDGGGGSRALNALFGAVAAIVLFFLPFQTVIGGAVAGYLQGPDTGEGLRVGALTGVFLLVPMILLVVVVGGSLFAILPFLDPAAVGIGALGLLALTILLLFGALYTVGLAALGGVLGAYLNREL